MDNKAVRKTVNSIFFGITQIIKGVVVSAAFILVFNVLIEFSVLLIAIYIAVCAFYIIRHRKMIGLYLAAIKDLRKNETVDIEIDVSRIERNLTFAWSKNMYIVDSDIIGGAIIYNIISHNESFLYGSKNVAFNDINRIDRFIVGKKYHITYLPNTKIIVEAKTVLPNNNYSETADVNEVIEFEKKAFYEVCNYLKQNISMFDEGVSCSVYLESPDLFSNEYASLIHVVTSKNDEVPLNNEYPLLEIVTADKKKNKYILKSDYIDGLEKQLRNFLDTLGRKRLVPNEMRCFVLSYKMKRMIV